MNRLLKLAVAVSATLEVAPVRAVAACTGAGAPFAEREVTAPRAGWRMLNGAAALALDGADVSRPGFDDAAWMPAVVPGTVLTTLVKNGAVPDPYRGLNNEISRGLIPDVSTNRTFYTAWFRTAFDLPAAGKGQVVWMRPEGINYRSEIWLNGRLAASTCGMFARNAVDVTAFAKPGGRNVLAVRVVPVDHPGTCRPKPWGAAGEWHNGGDGEIGRDVTMLMSAGWDFTFSDGIRDRNTGIWKDIAFFATGLVRLDAPYVRTKLNGPMDAAELTLEIDLHSAANGWGQEVAGDLTAEVEGTDVRFAKRVTLFRGERRTERLTATLANPKLWWPRNKGPQSLYTLRARFADAKTGRVSDAVQVRFGVREVTSDRSGKGGARQFHVNRRKVFIRGTNWIPEAMLKADDARMAEELRLTRDSGVNLVRLWAGGITESDYFYQFCDEYGLLVWQEFWMTGDTRHPDDPGLYLDQVAQQVRRIRAHASLAHWTASNESTEVAGTEALVRRLTGTSSWMMQSECDGVHDGSPYVPVNPMRHFRDEASDRGPRVYGFSPEYGTVALPSIDGIRKFMRDADLWPMDAHEAAWKYRSGGGFDRLTTTHRALVEAYGPASTLEEYVRHAQAVDALQHQILWEVWNRARNEATGVLFWYNNTPVPQLGSHAWDYDLEPTAAFFAQRNALEPLHAQYDYLTGDVWVSNDWPTARELTLAAEVYDFGTRKVWSRRAPVSVPAEAAVRSFRVEVPEGITKVHFVRLRLLDAAGGEVGRTFYWRSTDAYGGKDSLAGGAASGFESLPRLPATRLAVTREGDGWRVANAGSRLAFMVEVKPRRMTDNYFHLLPGESRHVEPTDGFRGAPSVSAWNAPEVLGTDP